MMELSSGSVYILMYIAVWVITLVKHKARVKNFGPWCFIVSTYIGYAIVSLMLYNFSYYKSWFEGITLWPFIYLFFMLMLALWPAKSYEKSGTEGIQCPSNYLIYGFIFVYCIAVVVTLPSSINNMRSGLSTLFSASNGGASLYHNAFESRRASDHSVSGLIGLFSVIQTCFRDMFVFVSFYYIALNNRKKWIMILFATIFGIDILSSIASGGRTFTIMLLLTVAVAYFTFRDYWDSRTRNVIRIFAIVLLVLVLIPFVTLTISRFVNRSSTGGVQGSLLYYIGQANLYFNKYAFNSNGIRYGDRTINEFKRILGFDVPAGISGTRLKYANMNINDGIYSTFVGDFVFDYGPVWATVIFLVFNTLTARITRTNKNYIPFHKLLLVYFTMCICAQGGMYLFYYSYVYNWVIVAFVLMYVVFHIDYDKKKGNIRYISKTTGKTD